MDELARRRRGARLGGAQHRVPAARRGRQLAVAAGRRAGGARDPGLRRRPAGRRSTASRWSATRPAGTWRCSPRRRGPESVVGVVAQAPVTDLVDAFAATSPTAPRSSCCGTTPERDPPSTAAPRRSARVPLGVPLLVVHGDADDSVPVEQGRTFAERRRARRATTSSTSSSPASATWSTSTRPARPGRSAAAWLERALRGHVGARRRGRAPR